MILVSSVAAAAPTRLDPLQLFLHADIVVQVVIAGLVLASVWVWMIVVSFSLRMGGVKRKSAAFEEEFWDSEQPETLVSGKRRPDNPSARVAAAGIAELRQSTQDGLRDRAGAKARIALAMEGQVASEAAEIRPASVRLRQRALREGNLLAEAAVRVGFISPDGRPRRQPAAWRAAFDPLLTAKDPA